MELSLCDTRKLSATEMEKVWEVSPCYALCALALFLRQSSISPQVLKAASNNARDAIFDDIKPPISFAFWRCTWQDFKLLAPLMLLVAFIDVLCVPLLLFVLCSGFRTRQVITRLRNSRGGYPRIILDEFMEILAVCYDVAGFIFVLVLLLSAAPMLAQLYDAFLVRSPTMARAAVRSCVKSTIGSVATFVTTLFTCKNLVNSMLLTIWFFFLPASVAFVQLKEKNVSCDFLYAMIIGFGLWVCPIICAAASGDTADNAARAFLAMLCGNHTRPPIILHYCLMPAQVHCVHHLQSVYRSPPRKC